MEEGQGRVKDVFAAVSWVRGSVGVLLQGPCLVRSLIYSELLNRWVERVEGRAMALTEILKFIYCPQSGHLSLVS